MKTCTVKLFKSALCPRCAYTAKILKDLQKKFPNLEIVSYDLVTDFNYFKDSGVKMIPTLISENSRESWILPKASEIRKFVISKLEK